MRVVNAMIFGNSLNNIFRNVRHINELAQQIETKKLIHRPSDNPLLAARSLRYRTILEETVQFLSNANAAMAWMETSESAFMNLLDGEDSSLQEIHRRLIAATDGVPSLDDNRAMVTEMREFFDQIMLEMNQTYMGRYVFSGFFANQPPIFNVDQPGRSFVVTQHIAASDIHRVLSFQNLPPYGAQPVMHNANIVKLPYRDIDFHFDASGVDGHVPPIGIFLADGTRVTVRDFTSYHPDAYVPADYDDYGTPVIHHIRNTGELVMSDAVRALFADGVRMVYEVRDLQNGELNPIVYFDTVEIVDVPTPGGPVPTARPFDAKGHEIRMEVAAANHITVNSLARDIYTATMFSDLRALFEFVENIRPSEERAVAAYFSAPPHRLSGTNLDNEVSTFLSEEESRINAALHDRFSNMLRVFEEHTSVVRREHASLGSRMNRVDMLVVRLEEEEINYTALLSANEDTPLQVAIMRKAAAEAAFHAALRANAISVQLSLVNFLR